MRVRWSRLGGQLGVGFCLVGFVLVFLGWNGAASFDRVPSQFPYLISGGLAGLAVVVVGVGLMVVQNSRADRALLEARLAEIREALERYAAPASAPAAASYVQQGAAGLVVAGNVSYHSPTCHLLEGRTGLPAMARQEAESRGLTPCRACDPAVTAPVEVESPPPPQRRRRTPARSR